MSLRSSLEVVKSEYESICMSHAQIIKMGESYGSFDPLGKIAFLDALEAVEERWDTSLPGLHSWASSTKSLSSRRMPFSRLSE